MTTTTCKRAYVPSAIPDGYYLTLRAACLWKGVSFRTTANNKLLQPMLGHTTTVEGLGNGERHQKRYFPRDEVEAWLPVFAGQREGYVRGLLARGNRALSAHILVVMEDAARRGRLPDNLRSVYADLKKSFYGGA